VTKSFSVDFSLPHDQLFAEMTCLLICICQINGDCSKPTYFHKNKYHSAKYGVLQ
jgi:hypothetical protein